MRVVIFGLFVLLGSMWGCNVYKTSSSHGRNNLRSTKYDKNTKELESLCNSGYSKLSSVEADWTFLVYIAANNNLRRYAIDNVYQMTRVGSNEHVNVIILLDEYEEKKLARYRITFDGIVKESEITNSNAAITGTKESLYDFVDWTVKKYPANHYCLVLWNHGSGIKDPSMWGRYITSYRDDFFKQGPNNHLTIDRTPRDFKAEDCSRYITDRGICFNDTYNTYLTNQDLVEVLDKVYTKVLRSRKLDIICMDACLMAMVEMASQISPYVNYFVASQEVEPGSGYNYALVLSPFIDKTLSPSAFAEYIVHAYALNYESRYADYTQSAMNLDFTDSLDEAMSELAAAFTYMLTTANLSEETVTFLEDIRMGNATLEFEDSDYIDLGLFLKTLIKASYSITMGNYREIIIGAAEDGLRSIDRLVFANRTGINLRKATGVSIYFPRYTLHSSYEHTDFSKKTGWGRMLSLYLKGRH